MIKIAFDTNALIIGVKIAIKTTNLCLSADILNEASIIIQETVSHMVDIGFRLQFIILVRKSSSIQVKFSARHRLNIVSCCSMRSSRCTAKLVNDT